MNKPGIKISILWIMLMMFFTIPSYGNTLQVMVSDDIEQESDEIIEIDANASSAKQLLKGLMGRLLSTGSVRISNEGNGVLGVNAETNCHTYVDEIHMTIFLDVLDPATAEDEEDWHTVNIYEYNRLKEDAPNEELYTVSVSFDIVGLERGRYYRLRCNHFVYSGGKQEALSSRTAFIPLSY